jgi:hypothetical protein
VSHLAFVTNRVCIDAEVHTHSFQDFWHLIDSKCQGSKVQNAFISKWISTTFSHPWTTTDTDRRTVDRLGKASTTTFSLTLQHAHGKTTNKIRTWNGSYREHSTYPTGLRSQDLLGLVRALLDLITDTRTPPHLHQVSEQTYHNSSTLWMFATRY